MNAFDKFRDPELCSSLLGKIREEVSDGQGLRFMEVCGTHTVAIFQSGLHSLLPKNIVHLSGPGCPVCVTHESEVAAYLELAARPGVIVATFGDLMKVPGPGGLNLKTAQAEGARVSVVYSPFDALKVAQDNPEAKVVFLGIGFETTAPAVAATVKMARERGLKNFYVLPFHKTVPSALEALMSDDEAKIEAFILPGHVSTVIGLEPYRFMAAKFGRPAAITGFEPVDLLQSLLWLIQARKEGRAEVANLYRRAVSDEGNPKARSVLYEVFQTSDALWRGIGLIPGSGLQMSEEWAQFDAWRQLDLELKESPPIKGCRCGDVLKGKMQPNKCPLFKKACTPASPVGPCMVSTEGSCAAYFKYQLDL